MSTEVTRNQTPEEQELEKKCLELASLENDLAQHELDLVTLRAELTAFETHYIRTVGTLYAELDEVEALIAEALARTRPTDAKIVREARQARARAQESIRSLVATQESRATPTESLKRLFREVAKQIHPDLATNEEDRVRRQKLMAEANRAYEEGNEERLRAVLDEWLSNPDAIHGDGIGFDLVRTIRKIAQIQTRLGDIENEIRQIKLSELYQLKESVAKAESAGKDVLAEMASSVEQQIAVARRRLAAIRSGNVA